MPSPLTRNAGVLVDPLFVGVTRPPMKGGVTYAAFILNFFVVVEAFLISHNLLVLLLFLPLHGVCWLLCLNEPRFFELLLLWGRTRGAGLLANARARGANSYSPQSLRRPGMSSRGHHDVFVVVDHLRGRP